MFGEAFECGDFSPKIPKRSKYLTFGTFGKYYNIRKFTAAASWSLRADVAAVSTPVILASMIRVCVLLVRETHVSGLFGCT